MIKVLH